ncbi:hypothetical protein DFA_01628 [Cavenderia fasciculata]|uniref:Beta-lactamase-related domain-containing protein n=1 Tax=Cavenderia fasciculata TaxID=261658 RepID=F4PTX4_CACFS|nr:uncharacterized protein DFA_01628 [Cavenderia fasciculata]EGG21742.1 hypothetical protein DFA_01628 [Cavenderia fasciculata]|eukprot:XP_004359592.1 hypothetical protein DFA_01628 [Cavenderia fasciculata]
MERKKKKTQPTTEAADAATAAVVKDDDEYVPLFQYRGSMTALEDIDLLDDMGNEDGLDDQLAFKEFNTPSKKGKRGKKKTTTPISERLSGRATKRKKRADFDDDLIDSNASEQQAQQAYESQFDTTLQRSQTTPIKTPTHSKSSSTIPTSLPKATTQPNLQQQQQQYISLDDADDYVEYLPSQTSNNNNNNNNSIRNSNNNIRSSSGSSSSNSSNNNMGIYKTIDIDDDEEDDGGLVVMGSTPSKINIYQPPKYQEYDVSYTGSSSATSSSLNTTTSSSSSSSTTSSTPYNSPIRLTFKLVGEEDVIFDTLYDTPIKQLVDTYCQKKQLDPATVQIKLYGLAMSHTKTPRELELIDGDELMVAFKDIEYKAPPSLLHSLSSPNLSSSSLFTPNGAPFSTAATVVDDTPKILLCVRYNGTTHKFKLSPSDPFEKIVNALMKKENIPEAKKSKVVLKFDGMALKLTQTPEDEDMEEEDLIDATLSSSPTNTVLYLYLLIYNLNNKIVKEALEDVGELIDKEVVGNMKIPSFTMTVVNGDNIIWQKTIGNEDPLNNASAPLSIDHNVRIGSVTKSFTALMMFKLRDEGVIDLDDRLVKYLPEFYIQSVDNSADDLNLKSSAPTFSTITLEEIASHQSGLPRDVPCRSPSYEDCDCNRILATLRTMFRPLPSLMSPIYSNLGYTLLGRALENALNIYEGRSNTPSRNKDWVSYEDYIRQKFLHPLGMFDTHFKASESRRPRAMSVKVDKANNYSMSHFEVTNLGFSVPMGGMWSTARDMSKYLSFLLKFPNDNKVLKYSSFLESLIPLYVRADGNTSLALPWEAFYDTENNYWTIAKSGEFEGYLSYLSFVRELNYGYFFNAACDNEDIFSIRLKIHNILSKAFKQVCCDNDRVKDIVSKPAFENQVSSVPNEDDYKVLMGLYKTRDIHSGIAYSDFELIQLTICNSIRNNNSLEVVNERDYNTTLYVGCHKQATLRIIDTEVFYYFLVPYFKDNQIMLDATIDPIDKSTSSSSSSSSTFNTTSPLPIPTSTPSPSPLIIPTIIPTPTPNATPLVTNRNNSRNNSSSLPVNRNNNNSTSNTVQSTPTVTAVDQQQQQQKVIRGPTRFIYRLIAPDAKLNLTTSTSMSYEFIYVFHDQLYFKDALFKIVG